MNNDIGDVKKSGHYLYFVGEKTDGMRNGGWEDKKGKMVRSRET